LQQDSTAEPLLERPLAVSDPSDPAEAEADRTADEVLMQREASSPHRIGALVARRVSHMIQRQTCTPAGGDEALSGLKLSGFAQGSSILPGKHYKPLQTLAALLKRGGGSAEVQVHGFASQEGDAAFNVRLSCTRAIGAKQVIQANGVRNAISLFQHGATTALGTAADDNRAVIVVEPTRAKTPKEKKPEEPGPPPVQSECDSAAACAANPDCPDDFCKPFPSRAEAIADRDSKRSKILSV
jgi:outer membrane protein OmpA-like peptidoglycan-associated protein